MTETNQNLTALEEKTLRLAVRRFAQEPFTPEAIAAAFPGLISGYEAALGIDRLRRREIIVTRKKAWGERIHMISPDVFSEWQQALLLGDAGPGSRACAVSGGEVEAVYEPRKGMARLLFYVLASIANEGLPLTHKGTFHKKDVQRLLGRFDVTETELSGFDIAYAQQDKLAKPLAVVFDAALRLGLVRRGVARAEIVRDRVEDWLSRPEKEMDESLLTMWLDVYMPDDVFLQHMSSCLRKLPGDAWISVDRLCMQLLAAGADPLGRSADEATEAALHYWIRPLAAFGWLALGRTKSGFSAPETETAMRRTVSYEEGQGWYIQPDFEVFVPPGVPYSARWELEAFAEFAGGDEVEKYHLTKRRWEHALASGYSSERMIETLAKHAVSGLAEHVEGTLQEWSAQFGAVTIEAVTLLRCRSKQDADFIRNDALSTRFILGEIGDRDFIVDAKSAALLKEHLRRQGFSPRITEYSPELEAEPAAAESGRMEGIVFSRRNALLFPVDPSPPGMEQLKARIDRVPQSWLRAFRKYHPSTFRELLETAIDVRTAVKLKVEGRELEMIPTLVRPAGSEWILRGYVNGAETEISSELCEAAQLLLPEPE